MTTTLLFSLSKTPDLYFCILAQNGIENVGLPLGRAVVVIITEIISVSINLESNPLMESSTHCNSKWLIEKRKESKST